MKAKYLDGIPKLQELIRLMGISALRAKMKPSMTATIKLFCRTTARGAVRGWAVTKMDEYIKREAALALVRPDAPEDEKAAVTIATAKKLVRSIVRRIPAADVAPVAHGRWVKHYRSGTTVAEGYVSTCCDMWNNRKSDYCPNCGAKMDGDSDG